MDIAQAVPSWISSQVVHKLPILPRSDTDRTVTLNEIGTLPHDDSNPSSPLMLDLNRAERDSDSGDDSDVNPVKLPTSFASLTSSTLSLRHSERASILGSPAPPPTEPLPNPPNSSSYISSGESLSEWAPIPPAPTSSQYPHFPSSCHTGPTSFAIASLSVQMRELEYSVSRLVSMEVLDSFIRDPRGRANFRNFLATGYPAASVASLDLWTDFYVLEQMNEKARRTSLAIRDIYMSHSATKAVSFPPMMSKQVRHVLRDVVTIGGLEKPSQHLLSSLFANEFQSYVKQRLIQQTSVKLGNFGGLSSQERTGLGEAFVLSNPRLRDCPIVLCSPAFCALTGYSASECVGRNCRFLQGYATAPSSVTTVREALAAEEGFTQLLLNYTSSGKPFWNLLCCIPLRDARGELTYFIGGQTNVTGTFAYDTSLSFLLGADDTSTLPSLPIELSREVQARAELCRDMPLNELALDQDAALSEAPSSSSSPSPQRRHRKWPFSSKGKKEKPPAPGTVSRGTSPLTPPPTTAFSSVPGPLNTRMHQFTASYENVLLFRRSNRQILFASRGVVEACGLPSSTREEELASPLLRRDVLDILDFASRQERKEWLGKVQDALDGAASLAIPCRLRAPGAKSKSSFGVFFLSPLQDHDLNFVAFVGVFGDGVNVA